jgi:hypothetical protein
VGVLVKDSWVQTHHIYKVPFWNLRLFYSPFGVRLTRESYIRLTRDILYRAPAEWIPTSELEAKLEAIRTVNMKTLAQSKAQSMQFFRTLAIAIDDKQNSFKWGLGDNDNALMAAFDTKTLHAPLLYVPDKIT